MTFFHIDRSRPFSTICAAVAILASSLLLAAPPARAAVAPNSVTLFSDNAVAASSDSVLFEARVVTSGALATGTITFKVGSNTIGSPATLNPDSGNTYTRAYLSLFGSSIGSSGKFVMTATYSGNSNYTSTISTGICQVIGSGAGLDLSGCDFSASTLASPNLANANLTNANFSNSTITSANLSGANFSGATLTGVTSSGLSGSPSSLPSGWSILSGSFAYTAPVPSQSPQPVLQQVGQPTGGCASVADQNLNWGGSGSGGWGTSWAQWVNGGRGGAVCTRFLVWTTTGRWTVAS